MDEIEERVRRDGVQLRPVPASKAIEIRPTGPVSYLLTVSEIFPLELRGQAITFFFAISQLAGGVAARYLRRPDREWHQ